MRCGFDFFEGHQRRRVLPLLPGHMRSGCVVCHAIDPGPHRTPGFIAFETLPESQVNVLKQVLLLVGTGLISANETLQHPAVRGRRLCIKIVLSGHYRGSPISPEYVTQLSVRRCYAPFLTEESMKLISMLVLALIAAPQTKT